MHPSIDPHPTGRYLLHFAQRHSRIMLGTKGVLHNRTFQVLGHRVLQDIQGYQSEWMVEFNDSVRIGYLIDDWQQTLIGQAIEPDELGAQQPAPWHTSAPEALALALGSVLTCTQSQFILANKQASIRTTSQDGIEGQLTRLTYVAHHQVLWIDWLPNQEPMVFLGEYVDLHRLMLTGTKPANTPQFMPLGFSPCPHCNRPAITLEVLTRHSICQHCAHHWDLEHNQLSAWSVNSSPIMMQCASGETLKIKDIPYKLIALQRYQHQGQTEPDLYVYTLLHPDIGFATVTRQDKKWWLMQTPAPSHARMPDMPQSPLRTHVWELIDAWGAFIHPIELGQTISIHTYHGSPQTWQLIGAHRLQTWVQHPLNPYTINLPSPQGRATQKNPRPQVPEIRPYVPPTDPGAIAETILEREQSIRFIQSFYLVGLIMNYYLYMSVSNFIFVLLLISVGIWQLIMTFKFLIEHNGRSMLEHEDSYFTKHMWLSALLFIAPICVLLAKMLYIKLKI